jgi:cyclopropane fatty-acyl-phospholipid synthase-like methyltransferase
MPKSSPNGKKWTKEKIKKLITEKSNLLDIGCGRGTYKDLFKDVEVIANSNWVAVEVWEPYISQFNLTAKYNKILNEDARALDWKTLGNWDLVFMGDVLEHMTKEQAQELVDLALKHTKYILISIPIVYMPQGADGGNEYEIHVKPDWSDKEVLESFPNIVEHHKEGKIGVYLLKGAL